MSPSWNVVCVLMCWSCCTAINDFEKFTKYNTSRSSKASVRVDYDAHEHSSIGMMSRGHVPASKQEPSKRLVRRAAPDVTQLTGLNESLRLSTEDSNGEEGERQLLGARRNELRGIAESSILQNGDVVAVVADGKDTDMKLSSNVWTTCPDNEWKGTKGDKTGRITRFYCAKAQTIKLTMHSKTLTFNANGKSLKDLMTGSTTGTGWSTSQWTGMAPGGCWQNNCNREGFNVACGGHKCRLGLVTNQENDCNSCDSAIGVGCNYIPAGNVATCCANRGTHSGGKCKTPTTATISVTLHSDWSTARTCTADICGAGNTLKDAADFPADGFCAADPCTEDECCQTLGTCDADVCGEDMDLKDAADQPADGFCAASNCTQDECCDEKKASGQEAQARQSCSYSLAYILLGLVIIFSNPASVAQGVLS